MVVEGTRFRLGRTEICLLLSDNIRSKSRSIVIVLFGLVTNAILLKNLQLFHGEQRIDPPSFCNIQHCPLQSWNHLKALIIIFTISYNDLGSNPDAGQLCPAVHLRKEISYSKRLSKVVHSMKSVSVGSFAQRGPI